MKIHNPLLNLIVDSCVLKQFWKIRCNKFLWFCMFSLLLHPWTFLLSWWGSQHITKRKSIQLLLYPSHRLKNRSKLSLHLLRTAITILMQIVPIFLQHILHIFQKINHLYYYISFVTETIINWFVPLDGVQKATLVLISIWYFLFFKAVLTLLCFLWCFFVGVEDVLRTLLDLLFISCEHIINITFTITTKIAI